MTDAFIADPRRDASAVIRGFVYQVDLTIQRWMNLRDGERLELERGEDIDLIARGIAGNEDEQRITEQVKSREENLTLRSAAALQSITNFALHRERNPGHHVLFRFTTNARAGTEQGADFPASLPGIVAWRRVQSRAAGESEELVIAEALRNFFRSLPRPTGVADEAWDALQRIVAADDREWLIFLTGFEWSTESDEPASLPGAVQQQLVASGVASAGNAEQFYHRLFVHVFRLLAMDGEKTLSREDLDSVLAATPEPTAHAQIVALLERMAALEIRMAAGERRLSNIETAQHTLSVAFDGMASAIAAAADLPSVGVVPVALTTDLPTAPAYRISRAALVQRLRSEVPSGWLALHGDMGSGKTQLAHLIGQETGSCLWLRFTDVPPQIAGGALRQYLADVTNHRAAAFSDIARALFEERAVKTIVLDDLPRLDSRSTFMADLIVIGQSAAAAGALVISTSLHLLPGIVEESLGATLRELSSPTLSDAEVEEMLTASGASTETAHLLAPLIQTIGEGHTALVSGIAQHLRRQDWSMTAQQFVHLLTGEHAARTRSELLGRLMSSIVDQQTRQLLYRLLLAVGDLTIAEVQTLASAPPPIDAPRERLSQLEGLWVQVESEEHIRVPALVRLLQPDDLPFGVREVCYGYLAFLRMRRGTLSPTDVIMVISYFTRAGMHYQAGLAAAQGFMELERLGPIPDAGLSDWYMWSLPDDMPAGVKLLVRGTQLGMRMKWNKDTSFLLTDIDAILASTDNPFERSGVIIPAGKLLTADPAAAWRALPLLRHAMAAHDDGRAAGLPVVPIPDEMWVQSIFLAGYSVRDETGLRELQRTVETLSAPRRAALDALQELEQMFLSIPSNFFLDMYRQPANAQNWQTIVEAMRELAAWALRQGWPLLYAHATRIKLVVLGEHIQDIDQVVAIGTASCEETNDPQARGLIETTVARQLNLKNRWADARPWYSRGLSRPASSIEQLGFDALIGGANAEQEFSLAAPITYLERAVQVADGSPDLIGPIGQAAARGELAIARLLNGDQDEALTLWDEVGRRLLMIAPADDGARGTIALFLRHSAYFYFSAIHVIGLMHALPPERRPVTPAIGQFHADLRPLGSQLDSSWRGRVALLLGKIAFARGLHAEASTYGQTALADFADNTGISEAVVDEAHRLASGRPSADFEQPE
jgi:hypothetical protein